MLKRVPLSAIGFRKLSTVLPKLTLGFIGLGHMGSKMVENIKKDGHSVIVYDPNPAAVAKTVDGNLVKSADNIKAIAEECTIILSMLPNDAIVKEVSAQILAHAKSDTYHISCSTISPTTSRALHTKFSSRGLNFIAAPVFARPDGIAKRQATWMISGSEGGRRIATGLLTPLGNVVDYGEDVGAANVVKLCGNFLIASSIEAISESMALAEKHGVDRHQVMNLLSSSIFDCLIYKGYGDRVSKRDHRPGGFSLGLGLKDVSLVNQAAREGEVPMPFLSVLVDRYTSAKARGRENFDWSAIGLSAAEDAGIDVSEDIKRNINDIEKGNTY